MSMRKLCVAAVVGIWSVAAMAQDGAPAAGEEKAWSVSLELPVLTAYVWRGYTINDSTVVQPSLTLDGWGLSVNLWANYNVQDQEEDAIEAGFSEFDPSITYTLPLEVVEIGVGAIQYKAKDTDAAYEGYVTLSYPNDVVTPSAEVYKGLDGDDGMNGIYVTCSLARDFEMGDWTLSPAVSTGYGDADFNGWLFGAGAIDEVTGLPGPDAGKSALSDGSVSISAAYTVNDVVSLAATGQYVWFWNAGIRDALDAAGMDTEMVVGGLSLNLAY